MWCPFCNHTDTRVVDSRLTSAGFVTAALGALMLTLAVMGVRSRFRAIAVTVALAALGTVGRATGAVL